MSEGTVNRVGIFVDVQNLFYSARLRGAKINYATVYRELSEGRNVIKAVAYTIQKETVNHQAFVEALKRAGFDAAVKVVKDDPRHGSLRAGPSWNVGIAVDAIISANTLETVVLVSGDGAFLPMVTALVGHNRKVEVVSFAGAASQSLVRAATSFREIPESWTIPEPKFNIVRPYESKPAPTAAGSKFVGLTVDEEAILSQR